MAVVLDVFLFVWTTAVLRISLQFGFPGFVVSVPFRIPYRGRERDDTIRRALDFKAWAEERGHSLCLDSEFAPRDVPNKFLLPILEKGWAHIGPAGEIRPLREKVEVGKSHVLRCGACRSRWSVDGAVRIGDTVCPQCGSSTRSAQENLDMIRRGKMSVGEGRMEAPSFSMAPIPSAHVHTHGVDIG